MLLFWIFLFHLTLNSTVKCVNVPAHLIQKYALIAVKRGDNSVLSCDAFGSPPIAVHWIRRVDDSSPSNPSSIASSSSSSPLTKSTGKLITLPVTSLGTRLLESEFSKNQRNLLASRFNSFQIDFPATFAGEVRTLFELYISNSELTDTGVYYCNVSNEFGDDSKTIDLTILDVPSAPQDIMIDGTWSRGVSLKWRPSQSDGNSLITEYIIQYWQFMSTHSNNNSITKFTSSMSKDATTFTSTATTLPSSSSSSSIPCSSSSSIKRMFEEEVSSSVTSHVLRGTLIPGSTYCLRMMGKNQYGRGDMSNIISFHTKSEPPSQSPIDLSAESIGSTVLVIKWRPPPKEYWNGQLTGYKIGYRVLPHGNSQLITSSIDTNRNNVTTTTVSTTVNAFSSGNQERNGEEEEESAQVEAAITNVKGTRASGFIAKANDDSAAVSLGSSVESTHETSDASLLSDNLPLDLDQFTLKEVPFSAIPSEEQQLILTGLSRGTTYLLIVQAVNDAGSGPFSQPIHVSTSSNDLPEPPVLWVTQVTETSIKLKWDQRRNPSDLTHYILYYKDERSPWMEIAFPVPEDKKYELLNLQPQSWYQLYMRAVSTGGGTSDPSEVLTITTQAKHTLHQQKQQFKGHISSSPKQSKNDPAGNSIGNSGHSHHNIHQGYHNSNGGHSLQISAAMAAAAAAAASGSNSPYHSRSTEYSYPTPLYTSTIFILIITVAIVIVIIACSFAYIYVKMEERKVVNNNCFMANGHTGYTAIGSPNSSTSGGGNFKWISGYPSSQFNQVASSFSSGSSPGTVSSSCASTPGAYKGGHTDDLKLSSTSSSTTTCMSNNVQSTVCTRNLLNPRPPVPTFLWASQGPISEEDSDDLASNSYATLPFDRLLLHKDQGQQQQQQQLQQQQQMATQVGAIPLDSSSSSSSPSKGGSICVSAQVHPHQNKSNSQTMEIFVNNMYDIPCHLPLNYNVKQDVKSINDQITSNENNIEQYQNSTIPSNINKFTCNMNEKQNDYDYDEDNKKIDTNVKYDDEDGDNDSNDGTYLSNGFDEPLLNELSWQNNLPKQTSKFISTGKSHGSDSCQDDLAHCIEEEEMNERISEVTMNANCSNFNNISSHGSSHINFIRRERKVNECDINLSSGKYARGSLASFNCSFVSPEPLTAGESRNSKLRPQSYCFANSNISCDTSNLLHHQNHNQGNQKEQEEQVNPHDQRPVTRKSCVISAV